jgi:trans-aconitate 2-methyltransferase
VSAVRSWDAATYERVAGPQRAWAGEVLDRLGLRGDETVLDAGCGGGSVTELLLERLPHGRVVAVDADADMVATARDRLGARADVLQGDLTALHLDAPVDAAFSNAVFHWVLDHDALFAALRAALRPGGVLSAQCGGAGNIARVKAVADRLAGDQAPPRVWNYAGPEETEERLRRTGFADVRAWLEPRPVTPPEPATYLETVVLGPYVQRLPEPERRPFAEAVLAELGDPPTLDYVRLNIVARRGAAGGAGTAAAAAAGSGAA